MSRRSHGASLSGELEKKDFLEEIIFLCECSIFVQILFEEHRPPKSHVSRHPQPLDNYEKAERVWERLLSAHSLGDCLITVATSEKRYQSR